MIDLPAGQVVQTLEVSKYLPDVQVYAAVVIEIHI